MEKVTCELSQDEYKLICFYGELSEEKKSKFFHLVMTLETLLVSGKKAE